MAPDSVGSTNSSATSSTGSASGVSGSPRIELRIGAESKAAIRTALAEADIRLNAYADALFDDPAFSVAKSPSLLRLVIVSLADLGLAHGGRFDQIVAAAGTKGLELCPLEVAPLLRLQLLDQPVGPYLTVASPEIRDDAETPNGFYLRNIDGQLWLRGYESGPENIYAPDFTDFVFVSVGP